MTQPLDRLTDRLLQVARSAGAEAADAIAVRGTSLSIDIRERALEQAERAESVEVGLRVLLGGRQACVSASDISEATLSAMAERAVAMAREAPDDPCAGLADSAEIARGWDLAALELVDPSDEPSPAALEEDARAAEAAALETAGIFQVEAGGAWSRREMHLAASNGFSGGYARSSRSISAVAFTGSGTQMERDWAAETRIFGADLPAATEVGRLAAERAMARVGSRKPPTGSFPVLYDERIAASLMSHLLSAVNGATIARGGSWLRDALGQQVLPAHLSFIEDPLRPRTGSSRPFDGEGLPTRRRAIVENGFLTGWTLDLATGRKLKMASTANAARSTSQPPSPSVSNTELTPGTVTRAELLAQMGTGLLVTSLMGSSINGNTGDYSRGASGFWVERGEIVGPVNECTIAGNLRDMLRTIVPANDARPHLSNRVPSLLVEGLTIAGA
ncbi:TldD/PmbA family protein [Cereibacter johrii]|uniref:Microcin-processing peptidase 1 n=1 Tax=Cereibacter johrii TaxID=445629 RepID=A0ABX5JE54_9RHOB|nr:TldD/PmbA family protein [Cereibacter johrii]ODM41522.1 modulator protein [Cereibacter johrii]ODM43256.1 modulator protein [Cereibacter johrii]PTM79387.1 microcin-processing peptidase 1 [Cereibacter johrii]